VYTSAQDQGVRVYAVSSLCPVYFSSPSTPHLWSTKTDVDWVVMEKLVATKYGRHMKKCAHACNQQTNFQIYSYAKITDIDVKTYTSIYRV